MTRRMFMQNGLRRSLGYPIGSHSLRRLCATLRHIYGGSAEEAAEHLDDTEAVVRKSYIDEGYVRKVGRRTAAPGERPALQQVWQIVDMRPPGWRHGFAGNGQLRG